MGNERRKVDVECIEEEEGGSPAEAGRYNVDFVFIGVDEAQNPEHACADPIEAS